MRFSFTTLATFVAALLPTTNALVLSYNLLFDDGTLTSILFDNGLFRCQWEGKYARGSQQFMACEPGIASWIQINPGNPPPAATQAYAYGGQNFRWAIRNQGHSKNYWIYNDCQFGCGSAAAAKAMGRLDALQWSGNETNAELRSMVTMAIEGKEGRPFTA